VLEDGFAVGHSAGVVGNFEGGSSGLISAGRRGGSGTATATAPPAVQAKKAPARPLLKRRADIGNILYNARHRIGELNHVGAEP
jgi:hypothetical protein